MSFNIYLGLPFDIFKIILIDLKELLKVYKVVCKDWKKTIDCIENKFYYKDQIYYCVENGHLSLLKNIISKDWLLLNSYNISGIASKYNQINILEWLKETNNFWSYYSLHIAIKYNQLDVIQWFIKEGHKFNETDVNIIIENNNLKLLKWLYKNTYCEITKSNFNLAIMNNNIDFLKWLLKYNCPVDKECYFIALEYNCKIAIELLETKI